MYTEKTLKVNLMSSHHKEKFFPSFLCTHSTHECIHLFVHLSFKWKYPSEEDMIEWAKRESERDEEQRLARLNQQEQEELELAIALSKSEISEA